MVITASGQGLTMPHMVNIIQWNMYVAQKGSVNVCDVYNPGLCERIQK